MKDIFNFNKPSPHLIPIDCPQKNIIISKDGIFVCRTNFFYLHPFEFKIEGVNAEKNIFDVGYYVGKDKIYFLDNDKVILLDTYLEKILGKQVLDSNKKSIGIVSKVFLTKKFKKINYLLVRNKKKGDIKILSKFIKKIGENVLLKVKL